MLILNLSIKKSIIFIFVFFVRIRKTFGINLKNDKNCEICYNKSEN